MVHTSTDPLSNPKTYLYSGTYYGAFPTTVTNALNQSATYTYDFNTGLMASMTDPNNQTTSLQYDNMLRPTSASYPDGGQQTFTPIYTGGYFTGASFSKKITSSQNLATAQLFDGLGRLKETQLNSDPGGTTYTDIAYDAVGRKSKVWNPTRCYPAQTNCGESTWGFTTYNYDPLNRVTSVAQQDGSTVSTSYAGNCTTVTDEAQKARKSCADGLGRMTGVWEDPNVLNYQTSYNYDALDNLLSVTQSGSRQRTFVYDSSSRLTQATNPESGTINYTYDANGNAKTKTDARNITTTYSYDALNRLTSKSYSDGVTPTYGYFYDSLSTWGYPSTNTIGRLVSETDFVKTYNFHNYDAMGRGYQLWNCLPPSCVPYYSETHYDLAGNVTSETNLPFVTFSRTYDTAGRPTQLSSSWNDSQHPTTLAAVNSYFPPGEIQKMTLGNGLMESNLYESRLQACGITLYSSGTPRVNCGDPKPSGTVQDFGYVFGTWGTSNSGNITYWAGAGAQNFARSYGYDNLNRLNSLSDTVSGNPCPGLSWSYDAWGNRTDQTVTSGSCGTSHLTINALNRITNTGIQYDAAGNMINDGTHTYTYDAENRISKVDNGTTATYAYDADGRRSQRIVNGVSTVYLYDFSSKIIGELDGSNMLEAGVRVFQ
jgi:YD repeat-containing protein